MCTKSKSKTIERFELKGFGMITSNIPVGGNSLLSGQMASTVKLQFSISLITDLIIGYSSFADELEQGISRTIVDYSLQRFETIIAKTVFAG